MYVCVCMCECVYVCVFVFVLVCVCVLLHVCVCVCVLLHVCVCVCVYVCAIHSQANPSRPAPSVLSHLPRVEGRSLQQQPLPDQHLAPPPW